jgi:cytochrome d ubiquinol oxidase subunit I
VAGGAVATSLGIALVLYNLLLLGFFLYAGRMVFKGPASPGPVALVGRKAGAIGLTSPRKDADR